MRKSANSNVEQNKFCHREESYINIKCYNIVNSEIRHRNGGKHVIRGEVDRPPAAPGREEKMCPDHPGMSCDSVVKEAPIARKKVPAFFK